MRKPVFAILATTALVSTGMLAARAEAMTPSQPGAAANTDLVQQAAVVCGPRGCVHRPTRIRPPNWNNSWGGGWGGGWNSGWGGGWNNSWGGGWNTWNGCPPGWTIQGGRCAPYRFGR
jgi:hypothetical protein